MTRILFFLFAVSISSVNADKIDRQLKKHISENKNEIVKVWIFFTDKGPSNQFNYSEVQSKITNRAFNRRAKIKKANQIDYTDFPVYEKYKENLSFYALILKESRWLNALSCRIKAVDAHTIGAFEFVKEIRLVAFSKTNKPVINHIKIQKIKKRNQTAELDYGDSFNQLNQVNVPILHTMGLTGANVNIAVLDDGFNLYKTHFSINSRKVIDTYDFIHNDTSVDDTNSVWISGKPQGWHGTIVLSVIAAYAPGLLIGPAYDANYMLYRTEIDSVEEPQEEDNWVAALERAEAGGADIVNSSVGYTDWYSQYDMDGETAVTTLATNIAEQKGLIVVNSAGNDGFGNPNTLNAPADGKYVIAVGSVTSTGNLSSFSSRGPSADGRIKPDILARGSNVLIASFIDNEGLSIGSGTSYSSPIVAGSIALLLQAFPELTPYEVRAAIRMTGSQAQYPDNSRGWGILDIKAAYDYIGSNLTINKSRKQDSYPNPFNESTRILISQDGMADLFIFDLRGREVAYFPKKWFYTNDFVTVSKDHLKASGVYFYWLNIYKENEGKTLQNKGKLVFVK